MNVIKIKVYIFKLKMNLQSEEVNGRSKDGKDFERCVNNYDFLILKL